MLFRLFPATPDTSSFIQERAETLMLVGHYGPAFALKGAERRVPLWVLFVAVQWMDVLWSGFVALGVERFRIVPDFTATNALDLYYMPFTHSLPGALVLAVVLG